ncbi:TIGR02530 family flagellar biosynthesis protein [Haloimpatiens sp. FM7330]|uniref:TIGR02530 family flagellar biosynthesis protein n=1 Tax=Haloimpatiens sp. FM7330 TaxID=3298610 RepID=UPI00363BB407
MGYRVINGKLYPVGNFSHLNIKKQSSDNKTNVSTCKSNDKNFKDILSKKISSEDSFTISNHASKRLQCRNINLDESDMKKINAAINKANGKGSKQCLILHKDMALITSIKNKTIITALSREESKENIFTNIDSVVFT